MHVQQQHLTPSTTTGGANAIANHVITGVTAKRVCLGMWSVAFSGGVPAAAVNATVADGTTTLTFTVPAAGANFSWPGPVEWASGASVTISVPAAGVGISAIVSAGHFIDPVV